MADGNTRIVISADDKTKQAFDSVSAGLDRLKLSSQATGNAISAGTSNAIRNASYQVSDFIVQVQGGQGVMRAMSQQLPQLLAGFGAFGAVAGIVAGVLPTVITAIGGAATEAKKLDTAIGDLGAAIGDVGKASREFDMTSVYKEFNKANAVVREGIIEQIRFQQEMIKTQQLLAEQSLSKSLDGLGDYTFLDKMKGAFADSGAEKLSKELGVSVSLAGDMLPLIKGLRKGTEDAGNFMQRFGIALAGSANANAQKLLKDIKAVADGGKEAAAAASRLSEAFQKMSAAGSKGQIAIEDKAAAKRQEDAYQSLIRSIEEKNAMVGAELQSTTTLTEAQKLALKTMVDIQGGYLKLTDLQKAVVAGKLEELLANDRAVQQWKDFDKATQEYLKHRQELLAVDKSIADLQDSFSRSNTEKVADLSVMPNSTRNLLKGLNQVDEAGRRAAEKLRDDLSDGKLSAEEYAEKMAALSAVLDTQKGFVRELAEAQEQLNASWEYGASQALQQYQDELGNVAKTMEQAVTRAFKGMEDALVEFVKTGKLDFNSLADSIISDLARIYVQRSIMQPLVGTGKDGDNGILGSLFSGIKDAIGLHSGGIVGSEATFVRPVDTSAFIGAPRYHAGGIAGDEVPAILRRGEGVFTPGQMAAMGGSTTIVNVIESPGKGGAQQQRNEGGVNIIEIFVERVKSAIAGDIADGRGGVPAALQTAYGLNRAAGAY